MNNRQITISFAVILCTIQIGCGDDMSHQGTESAKMTTSVSAPLETAPLTHETASETALIDDIADAERFDVSYVEHDDTYALMAQYSPRRLTPNQTTQIEGQATKVSPRVSPVRVKKTPQPWFSPRHNKNKKRSAPNLGRIATTSAEYFAGIYENDAPDTTTVYVTNSIAPHALANHDQVEAFGIYLCAPITQNGRLLHIHCGQDGALVDND